MISHTSSAQTCLKAGQQPNSRQWSNCWEAKRGVGRNCLIILHLTWKRREILQKIFPQSSAMWTITHRYTLEHSDYAVTTTYYLIWSLRCLICGIYYGRYVTRMCCLRSYIWIWREVGSYETLELIYQTTRRQIPEHGKFIVTTVSNSYIWPCVIILIM
jgi:hypothetical protein